MLTLTQQKKIEALLAQGKIRDVTLAWLKRQKQLKLKDNDKDSFKRRTDWLI